MGSFRIHTYIISCTLNYVNGGYMADVENIVGTAIYKVILDTSNTEKDLDNVKSIITNTMSSGTSSTATLTEGMAQLTLGVGNLKQAFNGLSTGIDIVSELTDSYNRYQASMNGVTAVAQATGNSVSESMQVVKDATANGLISQSDAAAAVKNLEVYGYTAGQAAEMIKIMADAAVYNRQANYSVSEAVRVTTEGIRMENSVLSDAAGINKNIAKMQEEYAKSLGISTNELSQAKKAQAVYNGVLQEGGIFEGNAEEYTNTLAGAQDKLGTAIEITKANLGGLFDVFSPVINGIAEWITNNEALVAGLTVFAGILVGAGGVMAAVLLAKKAIDAIRTSLTIFGVVSKAATGGLVGLAVGLAAIGGGIAAASVFNDIADAETEFDDTIPPTTQHLQEQGDASDKTAKKLSKLGNQLAKLTRDYERDLKQIAVKHEENLADLNKQIEEANVDYRRAIDERNAEFNVSMAKQERSHQETVNELMGQLNFLQRYNNDYNKQKLLQVQFALAEEQRLYQQETEAQQAEIDLQNQADKAKLDARLANLQSELDEELAFMDKHREDLNSVRHVILLDEIESLKERYAEQKKSYNEQIAEAAGSGKKIGDTLISEATGAIKQKRSQIDDTGRQIGHGFGDSVVGGALKSIKGGFSDNNIIMSMLGGIKGALVNVPLPGGGGGGGGWATGGFTGRGNPTEVAGVVHKGEFVVPANQVDQSTGLPKSGTGGNTYNITVTGGVWANSAQARREFAAIIKQAAQQTDQARLQGAPA